LAAHCRSHHLLVGVKLYKLKTAEISWRKQWLAKLDINRKLPLQLEIS
jgi:hypothetical protein